MQYSTEGVKAQGDHLFSKREPLLSLWQELAENFYPERADFTTARNLGDDMASHLMTSAPVLARRELGDSFGAMLRPSAKEWFHLTTGRPQGEDLESRRWLEWMAGFMRRAMYDRKSMFARATKEADHDYAAFGQAVISTEINRAGNGLLYRCWHLRDVAWAEDAEGGIGALHRNWKPTAVDLAALFPKTLHPKVREKLEKDPYHEVKVRHIVMPTEQYMQQTPGAREIRQPLVSIFLDCDNLHELEVVGLNSSPYTVARWQTVSGSQYAHSPAAIASLPDGRLLQDITRVILEAGEKAANPPLLGVQEAIRSDISVFAGGVTWVDAEYDERLGEVLRPLTQDKSGLGFGLELMQDLREQLKAAWYISRLSLPPQGGPDMTAYEVGQRVQEYIRGALPLFEPIESDYNGQLCDNTFEVLMRNSAQLRASIPRSLQGREVQFTFESPLRDALEKVKVGKFLEAQQVLAAAVQLDPSTAHLIDGRKAARDVLGAVAPAEWLRTEDEVEQLSAAEQEAAQIAQAAQLAQQGAQAAKTMQEARMVGEGEPQ